MRVLIIFSVLVASFSAFVFADTIHVPADQPTIQAGIDAAVNGDTVLVAPGTYVENIDFHGKAITVKSSGGAAVTTIDGNQAGSVVNFQSGEENDSVIDGFTLTNGKADLDNGGGIHCDMYSSPSIMNNTIRANSADWGGGLFVNMFSEPQIISNLIKENTSKIGGGICIRDYSCAHIYENIIINNSASNNSFSGGGIYIEEGVSGVIKNNFIANNYSNGPGGGIYIYRHYTTKWPLLLNNTIMNNMTEKDGGGIYLFDAHMKMINNVVTKNTAAGNGGGIYCTDDSTFVIINNSIIENQADVYGGGMYIQHSECDVVNTIFWNNIALTASSPPSDEMFIGNGGLWSVVVVSYSNVRGGQENIYVEPGSSLHFLAGMIDTDPMFAEAAYNDFHLTHISPCRDAGDNTVVTELYDFEDDPRISNNTVDMGADEFYTHLYITGDQNPGGEIKGKIVGLPGTSPVRLFIGLGGIRPTPLPTAYGDFWLLPPRLSIPLVPIPAEGILAIPTTIPLTPPAPYDIPMQGLVGLNSDSLTNLCVLEVR